MNWAIYDANGTRKYLTREETKAFLRAARKGEPALYGFCALMAHSGCRISEALAMTARSLDLDGGQVAIECLKKRRRMVYRSVPLPSDLLKTFDRWLRDGTLSREGRLWPWSRMTAYRRICEVMHEAGIAGAHASPKGLRHGFGVAAIQSGVPLNLVQRWLGHADIKTTTIYTSVIGPEERAIASRMWNGGPSDNVNDMIRSLSSRISEIIDKPSVPPMPCASAAAPVSFLPESDQRHEGIEWIEATIQTLLTLQRRFG